jgi:hypothetical protein
MLETMTERRVTFTLKEAAAITQLRPQAIRDWCMYGHLTPVVHGTPGPGKQHRFSGQQVIGLAAVSAMYAKKWTTRTMGNAVLQMFSEMSDAALLDWLGLDDPSGRGAEAGAAFDTHPLFLDHGRRMSGPKFEEVNREMKFRMERAEDAVRRRLLGLRDRFDRPTKKR